VGRCWWRLRRLVLEGWLVMTTLSRAVIASSSVMPQAVKAALVALTIIAPAREALSATITVHEPDSEGRVFVDFVGKINDDDFKTFKEKTDQIYPIGAGHPKKQVFVMLMSCGGSGIPALQIGDWMRTRGMSTFVPGDRTCASACALIWLAGRPRTVGDTPKIEFHAAFDGPPGKKKAPPTLSSAHISETLASVSKLLSS
jgi:hypothetical protein